MGLCDIDLEIPGRLIYSLLEEYRDTKNHRYNDEIINPNYIDKSWEQLNNISCDNEYNLPRKIMLSLLYLIKHHLMVFFRDHIKIKLLFIPEVITLREKLPKKDIVYHSKRDRDYLLMFYSLIKLNSFFARLSRTKLEDFFSTSPESLSPYTFALTVLFVRECFLIKFFQSLKLDDKVILKYIYFVRCESTFLLDKDESEVFTSDKFFNPLSLFFFTFFDLVKARRVLGLKSKDLNCMSLQYGHVYGKCHNFMKTCQQAKLRDILGNIKETINKFEETKEYVGVVRKFRHYSAYLRQLRLDLISEHRGS